MKKLIFISGIVSANLMLFGAMFKVMHWPGAGVMLVLAIAIFSLWFLPASLIKSYKSQEVKKYKSLYIVTFFVFFVVILGALFKVMHWQGAGLFLIVGVPLPFVVFLPVYIYNTRNDKKDSMVNFLGIMFGLIFLAVFSVLLALNISRNILDKVEENIYALDNSRELISNQIRSENTKVTQKANELCTYIDDLKCELLSISDNNELCAGGKLADNYCNASIKNLDDRDVGTIILYKKGNFNILRNKVNEFAEASLASGVKDEELKNLISDLFDTLDRSTEDVDYKKDFLWGERMFPGMYLCTILNGLSQIQHNVRFVEAEL